MPVIQTRYRDIPIEEVRKCAATYPEEQWRKFRGQPVSFITPPLGDIRKDGDVCSHPAYSTTDHLHWICPGIAEIGD